MNRDQRLIAAAAVVLARTAYQPDPHGAVGLVDVKAIARLRAALNHMPRPPRIKRDRGEP